MKKLLIILTLCLSSLMVRAQSGGVEYKLPPTLIMPDGSVVPSNSLDSIRKVFGGREVAISIRDGKAYAHPINNKNEEQEAEARLNAHLGKPAPDFAFNDMSGKRYALAGLRGKVVVLNFWFTQCGGCIMEMPDLNELKQTCRDKDVVFLAATFDDEARVKAFLGRARFDYAILPDARKMCTDYNIYGYPTSMVIDRSGIVRFINSSIDGSIKSELKKAIEEVKGGI